MARRNWKHIRPNSIRNAIELCIEHARERKNYSVERIADLMGLSGRWTLYKWIENGRMPASMILSFEYVCGVDFVTQYQASSKCKLLVDIPTGRPVTPTEISELQTSYTDAISILLKFYDNDADINNTLESLEKIMTKLAWHYRNAKKHHEPELALLEKHATIEIKK